jgi:NRPS condensation-like uncharacterized protein
MRGRPSATLEARPSAEAAPAPPRAAPVQGCMPLNCADKCALALDSVNEPMLLHAMLKVRGRIDAARLAGAIQAAQEAHPVMKTLLRRKRLRTYREVCDEATQGVLTVRRFGGGAGADCERFMRQWMNEPLDMTRAYPFRVLLLLKGRAGSWLIFTVNHSAADGLRAVLFIRRVIEIYNGTDGAEHQASEVHNPVRTCDELFRFANSQRRRVKHYYAKMAASLLHRFIMIAVPPPTRISRDSSGSSRELDYCCAFMEPGEVESIQAGAAAVGAGLHDVLLAACYRTIERWNSMRGKGSSRIRIMNPVNISPKGSRNVVSNQASWLSPYTTAAQRRDPAKLLRTVRSQGFRAALNRTGFSLVYFFYVCSRFPLPLMRMVCRFLMITRTYVDSIVLTNIGVVWPKAGCDEPAVTRLGSARIESVAGLSPIVTPMGMSLSSCTYNGTLSVCLTYRTALFSRDSAVRFLGMYTTEVKGYGTASGQA